MSSGVIVLRSDTRATISSLAPAVNTGDAALQTIARRGYLTAAPRDWQARRRVDRTYAALL
jgi:hypothetical protein